MKLLKSIFFIVFVSITLNSSVAKEPSEFISEITDTASDILKQNISIEEKAEKLIIIAEETVDIDGIGLYSLGKHRKVINKEELIKYKSIFM